MVWALNISSTDYESVIGDLPSHAIAQFPEDHSYAVLCQGKQQLTRYDASGEQIGDAWAPAYDSSCGALSHEVFIDTSSERSQVLSLMHDVVAFDGTPTEYTLGQKLVKWDHLNNTMTDEFSIFDVMDPRTVVSWEDPFFPGQLECTNDEGVYGDYEMSDFTHCNSAATGSDDNYLVSSRATSTVLSIAKDGSGVQWTITTDDIGITSNFTFVDESDMFYNQHFVRQLDNGNIVMIDNGNTRPSTRRRARAARSLQDAEGVAPDGEAPYNPSAQESVEGVTDDSSSFSRACEYALDFDDMTIELVWEFAPSGIFTVEGGSIDALSNGNRLITFPVKLRACRTSHVARSSPAALSPPDSATASPPKPRHFQTRHPATPPPLHPTTSPPHHLTTSPPHHIPTPPTHHPSSVHHRRRRWLLLIRVRGGLGGCQHRQHERAVAREQFVVRHAHPRPHRRLDQRGDRVQLLGLLS